MENLVSRALFVIFIVSCCWSAPLENSTENLGELINTDSVKDCNCNWRYLKHYDAKKCQVTNVDDCGCPQSFLCSNDKSTDEPLTGCEYENKFYPVGSKITTSDNCQACRCINKERPKIQCVTKECPLIDVPVQNDCHLLYKKNKCCAVGFKCISDVEEENNTHLCDYNNKLYPVGSKIYPEEDPCLVCDCTDDWNGINNSSCRQHDCLFEKNGHLLDAGCIPVYHQSRCCPIEFYCPHNDLAYSSPPNASENKTAVELESQCLFADRLYPRGSELPVNNSCVECKCVTPPDFTCIHMSCPLPPNAENCYAKKTPGICCPSYECLYADEGISDSYDEYCPSPMCADSSCRIGIPPDSLCPTCICNSSESLPERNELEPMAENSEDMEAKQVEKDIENEQELDKLGEPLETLGNDIPKFDKMQEQLNDENPEVNDFTDMEEASHIKSNFNLENATDSNEVIERLTMQENTNNDETAEMDLEFKEESESSEAERQRNMHKRSQEVNQFQQQESGWNLFPNIEREGGGMPQGDEEYDGEMQSFKGGKPGCSEKEEKKNFDVGVPDGCPTPMCENETCKIEIPPGHGCPTCVCNGTGTTDP
ncbi:kielin/chordin-like protein [Uloborus diversus]|uniref:kielin/chordin-like protein n=1 Tax=Uloborus diversus TaxID=327109 RepID=UPI00240A208B|nr:kielin/chordin-like protein [Uloborus diversus]